MRVISFLVLFIPFGFCRYDTGLAYTASTPADLPIRNFLEIRVMDSVDFIRWKLIMGHNNYTLDCHYGIGKPNTNGFIKDGTKLSLRGEMKKTGNVYHLINGRKELKLIELNPDLLHVMDNNNKPMAGNGGWSYTVNKVKSSAGYPLGTNLAPGPLKDSIIFEGRTPCGIPGIMEPGKECYKLKWRLLLYLDSHSHQPSWYKLYGTAWRSQQPLSGKWRIEKGKKAVNGYQLLDKNERPFIYLQPVSDNIVLFTDADGNLLVGDKDFSYTLNKRN
ncbi:MAG TPA: hypothetical protein VFX58_13960 [Chitinophagaceae bacterium]|nr:hypothetical protein [Chitinophagaceae bacterium]